MPGRGGASAGTRSPGPGSVEAAPVGLPLFQVGESQQGGRTAMGRLARQEDVDCDSWSGAGQGSLLEQGLPRGQLLLSYCPPGLSINCITRAKV